MVGFVWLNIVIAVRRRQMCYKAAHTFKILQQLESFQCLFTHQPTSNLLKTNASGLRTDYTRLVGGRRRKKIVPSASLIYQQT